MMGKGIIKALECFAISKDFDERQCVGCAFETKGLCYEICSEGIAKSSLALINHQNEVIESKQKQLDIFFEFAGRLERIVEKNTDIKPCDVYSQVLKDMVSGE